MPINQLSLNALPAWCRLNDVDFFNVKIVPVDGCGMGIVAKRNLSTAHDVLGGPELIKVPRDLILSADLVDEYSKQDENFSELRQAVSPKSDREKILLFLLVQLAISLRGEKIGMGVSNPWTTYIRFLPPNPPVPTLWSDREKELLRGTSLEPALSAKLSALHKEFLTLKDHCSDVFSWFELLWERGRVSQQDWLVADALFRSRCLELETGKIVMAPCIDMANHSSATAKARYEANSKGELVLSLREGCTVSEDDEVTINYGDKSAAEMLFTYGFVDPDSSVDSLMIPLEPLPDDPLAKAKLYSFGKQPTLIVSSSGWSCPFAYLASLNEEDGLEFRLLQETQGSQELRVFWMGNDITDRTEHFETLIQYHDLADVLRLRAVTIVLDRLRLQLDRLGDVAFAETTGPVPNLLREECVKAAAELRYRESQLLQRVMEVVAKEEAQLMANKNVVAYLGSMETTQNDDPSERLSNEKGKYS